MALRKLRKRMNPAFEARPPSALRRGLEALEALIWPSEVGASARAWRGPFSPASLAVTAQGTLAFVLYRTDGHENWTATVAVVALVGWLIRALIGVSRGVQAGISAAVRPLWVFVVAEVIASLDVRFSPPGNNLICRSRPYVALEVAVLLLLLTYGMDLVFDRPPSRAFARLRRLALAGAALYIGVWIVHASPNPRIDLFPVQKQAAVALLAGRSIYEPGVIHTKETFANTDVLDEYTYFPLPACLTTAAYALGGDVRWASLFSQLLGAWLLWWIARRSAPRDPAALGPSARSAWCELLAWSLLFHPRGPFVLEQAWTEPLALPFLGGLVALVLLHRRALASICLGLLCAMKQHLFLYAPFLALLPGVGWSGLGIALATALVTIAPFAIPNPRGFYRGVFVMLVHNPFRPDALSLPADLSRLGYIVPTWVGFAAGVLPLAWLRRVRRTPASLLLASSVSFGLFYVFGRQAFCNYYYLLNATILLAAAAMTDAEPSPASPAPAIG